jgi:hypothetical protein
MLHRLDENGFYVPTTWFKTPPPSPHSPNDSVDFGDYIRIGRGLRSKV